MLTEEVFCLLISDGHCPFASKFLNLLNNNKNINLYNINKNGYNNKLSQLKNQFPNIYLCLQYLIVDSIQLNEERLYNNILNNNNTNNNQQDIYNNIYLSSYYFTADEQQYLALFPTPNNGLPFYKYLLNIIKQKYYNKFTTVISTNTSAHICSSHDIAPIYRQIFDLESKYYGSREFKKQHKQFIKKRNKEIDVLQKAANRQETLAVVEQSISSSADIQSNEEHF